VATTPPASPSVRRSRWPWLLAAALLAALAWTAWQWREHSAQAQTRLADSAQRLDGLEQRLDALRRDQRAQIQRLQHADATNRVLREELLGIGQRAALLEDSVARLADPERDGAQALRLDEAELLLSLGEQRLRIAGDLDGARRAYALAADVIDGLADPAFVNLRQSLAQERAALESAGIEPRADVLAELAALGDTVAVAPPAASRNDPDARPWWQRAFGRLIDVRRSETAPITQPRERAATEAALQLELTLARAAAERCDAAAYRAALARAQAWLERLWPDSPALRQRRARLQALAATALSPELPTLGSTLLQLRQLRAAR
jgi:uroporphyrin-3 C-methyltransferase